MNCKNTAELVLILFSLFCFATLLGLSIINQGHLNEQANEANKQIDAAKENVAQSLANMPWTLEHIYSYIDKNYSGDMNAWLKQRVSDIRANGSGFQP
jgi:hypothetical protein